MVWLGISVVAVTSGCLLFNFAPTKWRRSSTSLVSEIEPTTTQNEKEALAQTVSQAPAVENENVAVAATFNAQSPPRMPLAPSLAPPGIIPYSRPEDAATSDKELQRIDRSVKRDSTPELRPSLKPPRLKSPSHGSMAPPPRPTNSAPLRPPPSAAASLRVPTTRVLPNASMAPTSLKPGLSKPSRKVALAAGHSPLDWAVLTSNPNHKLRGKDVPDELIRITPSMLKQYNGRKGRDAWALFAGKVYNISPYLPFHPGGEAELMKGAGKDAGKLFMEVHPWVNWDGMLSECLVGILVGQGEEMQQSIRGANTLDEMD